ncbi:MAG: hypothetical protein LIO42_02325 [Oscillospiraceae bacterium]|nr:hypothetical protein [Oscillospiraceae bacterium]
MYICSKEGKTFKVSPAQKTVYERAGYTVTEETAAETKAKTKVKAAEKTPEQ